MNASRGKNAYILNFQGNLKEMVKYPRLMTIENFLQNRPGGEFRNFILRQQQFEIDKGHPMSIVATLANKFIEEGKDGLITYGRKSTELIDESIKTKSIKTNSIIPPDKFRQIFDEANPIRNTAAIFLGYTILELERALIEKNFDFDSLLQRCRGAIKDTPLTILDLLPGTPVATELISTGEWNQMIEASKRDSTLAIFFENREFFPDIIKNVFEIPEISSSVAEILPKYKEYANALSGTPNND